MESIEVYYTSNKRLLNNVLTRTKIICLQTSDINIHQAIEKQNSIQVSEIKYETCNQGDEKTQIQN